MKKKVLFDSYALLAYLKKEDSYDSVKKILARTDCMVIMNELNIGEVYYIIARHRGIEQADYFTDMVLPGLPIKVLSNNFDLILKASKLKAHYAMSYMDCFAIASAIEEKADILTGDPEFKQAADLVKIEWLDS